MVIIKTNQTTILLEMDWSKELRQKKPLGINGLIRQYSPVCGLRMVLRFYIREKDFGMTLSNQNLWWQGYIYIRIGRLCVLGCQECTLQGF